MRIRCRYANFQKVLLKFYLPMRSPCKYKQGSLHMRIRELYLCTLAPSGQSGLKSTSATTENQGLLRGAQNMP